MRIVTNQGSNIHPSLVAEYDLDLANQDISVDGVLHDTRAGITLDQVDIWMQTAPKMPVVLGSSATQLIRLLTDIAKFDREILFITSSRKIIGTYEAAATAIRMLREDRNFADIDIRLIDTGMTDVGAGLPVLLAAEARRSGETLDQIETRINEFCRAGRMAVYVKNLGGLVRGGRASFLRSWMANVLRVRPLLVFEDGELCAADRISTKDDEARALAEHLAEKIGSRRVWAGIAHGNDPELGERVREALGQVLQLDYVYAVSISPSIYLHTAIGSVGVAVFPTPSGVDCPASPSDGSAQAPS